MAIPEQQLGDLPFKGGMLLGGYVISAFQTAKQKLNYSSTKKPVLQHFRLIQAFHIWQGQKDLKRALRFF